MNPILMKDFIVIDVKEEYEGDFSNFNGTFVPSTYTPLYSTTIEIKKDGKTYYLIYKPDKKDMNYSSIANQEAKGFSYKILQVLIQALTSPEKETLKEFISNIQNEMKNKWSIHHALFINNGTNIEIGKIPVGRLGWAIKSTIEEEIEKFF